MFCSTNIGFTRNFNMFLIFLSELENNIFHLAFNVYKSWWRYDTILFVTMSLV